MHEVWSRARQGRHVVVRGAAPPVPEADPGQPRWSVVRVSCDAPWSTWGAVEGARRQIEALLGEQSLRWDEALDRMGTSTRLLGDLPEPTIEATLVGAANRFADQHPQRAALVFEVMEQADEATVQALRDIVDREGWLRLPLVLCVGERPTEGALAELLDAVDLETLDGGAEEPPAAFDWSSLPHELLLVMRAAATVGRSFEVELVSRLLFVSEDAVLMRLQQAADLGAPLADQGGGRFFLPEQARSALVQRVLPSLMERWHRRLGEILAESPLPSLESDADVDDRIDEVAPEPAPAPAPADEAEHGPEADTASGEIEAPSPADAEPVVEVADTQADPSLAQDEAAGPANAGTYEELFESQGEDKLRPGAQAATASAIPPGPSHPPPGPDLHVAEPSTDKTVRLSAEDFERLMSQGRTVDEARAAHHLSEAGLPDRAVEQYLAALRKVASRGDSRRALLIAEQALTLLDRQPPSRGRDLLHARVLAMAARVQWRGAGRGPALTLQGALETLDEAEGLLSEDAPVDLRTEIAQLIAGVCYDLGDISSLQRALEALSGAARDLMQAGEPTRAARLLNDQAAVYLRAGDPVRANHLLQQSRTIFDDLHRSKPDDPTVIIERAETEHLLARLPLHARLRAGREDDAYSMALGHARAAAEGYRRLGGRVELGRVSETMGRLELARGRHERAIEHLDAALQTSRQLGDMTGMARGTAALSDLYIALGRPAEALGALRDSVAFNVDKGSPLGLAFNRRTLERLRQAVPADSRVAARFEVALRELAVTIDRAEGMLGRVSVPDGVD